MSKSRSGTRKLQIITEPLYESHQLDLLSFVGDHALADFSLKDKVARTSLAKNQNAKVVPFHFHGNVDKNKTFTSFCTSDSNCFAVESVKKFISIKESDFGIIYIMASSGLGKTHILHALANELLIHKKSFYLSSPQIMDPSVDHFNTLKIYDVLLIDDLEDIEGNEELQKTFCQLMDYAQTGKMKIIITGDRRPKELKACDERFKGKLSAALIHQLLELNDKLAYDIVQKKCHQMQLSLDDLVQEFISKHHDFNVYGLESILHKLKHNHEIKNQQITVELATQEIRAMDKLYHQDDFRRFLKHVAHVFQISLEDLMSSTRRKDFALARHVAMFILKERNGMSVMRISELFSRDHSTVVYGVSRIKRDLAGDLNLQRNIDSILERCVE